MVSWPRQAVTHMVITNKNSGTDAIARVFRNTSADTAVHIYYFFCVKM